MNPHILAAILSVSSLLAGQPAGASDSHEERRAEMVRVQLTKAIFGRIPVKDKRVLDAMRTVPRHEFVPENVRLDAYEDTPLPIGSGQTISQPYIVAFMTEALLPESGDTILEIGTGSGYQAAVLAELVKQVYTIEIVEKLGERARADLERLGVDNVEVRVGDGYRGWPEHAPFDGIIVTAAPDHVPPALIEQLKVGGRMVIPVGPEARTQKLLVLEKREDGSLAREELMLVRFVPFTGEAQDSESRK